MAKALGVDPVKINWVQAKPDDRDQLLATNRADLVFSYPLPPAPGGQVDVAGPYFLGHADLVLAGMAAQTHYRGRLRIINRGVTDQRLGAGVKTGATVGVEQVNAALRQYIANGSWRQALEQTVGPSGFAIPSPPTPGTA